MRNLAWAVAPLCLLPEIAFGRPAADLSRAQPFESSLRRSIAVKGQEQARFTLSQRMAHYRVPAVSVAVIEGCRIVDMRAFGTADPAGRSITTRTLFQAGSMSKTVTAVTALKIVEQGRLSLDADVRPLLKSWTLPQSPLLDGHPVTLRGLLNHSAGINLEGAKGYVRGDALPAPLDILNGRPPANTPPIRVEHVPGNKWNYSGGGYYVAQTLMTDTIHESFASLTGRLVLRPLGMASSNYDQPLTGSRLRRAASAVGPDGSALPGGWRVNPELAANGLWTTPGDLARLLVAVAQAQRGTSQRFLNRNSVREMMMRGHGDWGLGVDLGDPKGPRRFGHTGHTVGFTSEYVMFPDTCQGAVVMSNADEGGWLVAEAMRAIGDTYGWPGRKPSPVQVAAPLTDAIAERFEGTYRLRDFPTEKFRISRTAAGGLYWARAGHIGRDLLPENASTLFSPDSRMTLTAQNSEVARAMTLDLSFGGGKNVAERID